MTQNTETQGRIRVGISHGDVNGISYEVIIKTLQDQRIFENNTVIVYGSSKVASYHRKIIDANDFNFNLIRKADQAHPRRPNIINLTEEEVKLDTGKSTAIAGELALQSLEMAVSDVLNNHLDVLVTAPINKKNIQSSDFPIRRTYRIPGRKMQCPGLPDADGHPCIPDRGGHGTPAAFEGFAGHHGRPADPQDPHHEPVAYPRFRHHQAAHRCAGAQSSCR